ncbi:unnamed protein product [Trichobilharzia szidati]|nr:unnamed protein product [Trichobilharzia szidati]
MSTANREIISIPVNCEKRTFEKQRRDLLNSLQNKNQENSLSLYSDDWSDKIDNWITSSWRTWDKDIQRLRSGMFSLLPLNAFGLLGTCDPLILMNEMEHQVQDIKNQICANDIPSIGVLNDYLKDAYEIGEDGKLRFKVRFDVNGFQPEDIQLSLDDNYIKVQAKKEIKTNNSCTSREFCRIVGLPKTINPNELKSSLTSDGVLMLEAPVSVPENQAITFNNNGQIAIQPNTSQDNALVVKGVHGCSFVEDEDKKKRLHIEMPIDPIYKPKDLSIGIDSNRVIISGRHHSEENVQSGNLDSFSEFSHSYKIPETLDPLSVIAQMINDTLVLEAPLLNSNSN